MENKSAKNVATVAGAGIGAWLGSSIGIAGFFGAVSGAVPLALIGAYATRKLVKSKTARKVLREASEAYVTKDLELSTRRQSIGQNKGKSSKN